MLTSVRDDSRAWTRGDEATHAAANPEAAALRERVQFLQRRLKYVLGVSAVFRQRIVALVRECADASSHRRGSAVGASSTSPPSHTPEMQRLMAAVLSDAAQVEEDLHIVASPRATAVGIPPGCSDDNDGGGGDFVARLALECNNNGSSRAPRTQAARDDIRKAHQLCLVLQEKNAAKEREIEARHRLEQLQTQHDALVERHRRFLELHASAGAGANGRSGGVGSQQARADLAVAAMRELYDGRIAELEAALLQSRTELARLHASGLSNPPSQSQPRDATAASGDVSAAAAEGMLMSSDAVVLQKQNAVLRARVAKLKEEAAAHKQASLGSTLQLNSGLDSLLDKIALQQRELDAREANARRLEAACQAHERGAAEQRAQCDLMAAQLAAHVRDGEATQSAARKRQAESREQVQSLSSAVDEYTQQLARKEQALAQMTEQLRDERRQRAERELEVHRLGVQLDAFRAKLDSLHAQEEQRSVQCATLQDVHSRIANAVDAMRESQASTRLAEKLAAVEAKLQTLESVEMQLRRRDDELALASDEIAQLRAAKHELHAALCGVSSLYAALPTSVAQVEEMCVSLDEHRAELDRSHRERRPADLVRVQGAVDLRLLELRSARGGKRRRGAPSEHERLSGGDGDPDAVAGSRSSSSAAATLPSLLRHAQRRQPPRGGDGGEWDRDGGSGDNNVGEDDASEVEDDDETFLAKLGDEAMRELLTIPPLPAAVNIAASLLAGHQLAGGADGSASPRTPTAVATSHAGALPLFASPSGGPGTERDVRLTFELFDDQGRGELGPEMLRLALATLGVAAPLPAGAAAGRMRLDEFVAFCMGSGLR